MRVVLEEPVVGDPDHGVAGRAEHVDACVGGFLSPWVKKLGYAVPEWDFSVPGVTSIGRPKSPAAKSTCARRRLFSGTLY